MKAYVWNSDDGMDFEITEIPEDLKSIAEEKREDLIAAAAEFDEELMELYIGEEEINVDQLKSAIRKGTLDNNLIPVYCGTAFKNKAVQPVLNA
jgi:elongation factor G